MTTFRQKLFRALYASRMKAFAGIPGPPPSLPLGNAGDFLGSRPWEVCAGYGRHGGMSVAWLLGTPVLVLNDPKLVGEVLESEAPRFYKNHPSAALRPLTTDSNMFIVNGEDWRRKRMADPLSMPGFDPWLASQLEPLRAFFAVEARALHATGSAASGDFYDRFLRVVFDAFAILVAGRPLDSEGFELYGVLARATDRRIRAKLPLLPILDPRVRSARARWQALWKELVAGARGDLASGKTDLARSVLRVGTTLTDDVLATQLGNVFFGGLLSTTSAIVATLHQLTNHPRARASLRADLVALGGGFDYPALAGCRRLEHAIRETLRLYPPAPVFSRNTSPDAEVKLGGRVIPPDTQILLSSWGQHRSPDHWSDPDRFDPDRWAGGVSAQNPYGSEYFWPFGRGPRTCVGEPFALFLVRLAVATVLRESEIDVGRGQAYEPAFLYGVMRPKGLLASAGTRDAPGPLTSSPS